MNLVVIAKLSATVLEMLHPVKTGILNLRRNASLDLIFLYICCKHTGSTYTTNILLESGGHEVYTTMSQYAVRLLLVHPEFRVTASVIIKKEVAKGRMM